MKQIAQYIKSLLAGLLLFSLSGCEEIMKVDLNTGMNAEDHYSSSNEVEGAFIGLIAAFNKVAEQTLILSELKGDLLRPTSYAPEEFWRIYRYAADNEDAYTNPGLFYDIVINCNDFIKRVIKYNRDFPGNIPEAEYRAEISVAICYKVWSLMMIGQFWGEAYVYEDNLETGSEQAMLRLGLDELPVYLIAYMNGGEDGVDAFQMPDFRSILADNNIDWFGATLYGRVLLAELKLWAGDYQGAIDDYLAALTTDASNTVNLTSGYRSIFTSAVTQLKNEAFTVFSFNVAYHQTNNLREYFLDRYYFAPTRNMIDLFDAQVYANYSRGDAQRKSATCASVTLRQEEDAWAVTKHFYQENMILHVYRAGQVYLNIAEAYACLGRFEEAITFLDKGLKSYWAGADYRAPFQSFPSALQGANGVRGRAGLLPLEPEEIFGSSVTRQDSIRALCGRIADETALELAYEGKRWPALVRMARNLHDPSFLVDKIVAKFDAAEQGDYRTLLSTPANWYIKDEKKTTLK
ncbi:MAG: RagB/SusD family nutrient uptake outer membrane protein [Odoribacteraceae bacterium]|nr:RagB/SusD family nutrient uptake outer membrane protein [Odoribacteraceae bacterium]